MLDRCGWRLPKSLDKMLLVVANREWNKRFPKFFSSHRVLFVSLWGAQSINYVLWCSASVCVCMPSCDCTPQCSISLGRKVMCCIQCFRVILWRACQAMPIWGVRCAKERNNSNKFIQSRVPTLLMTKNSRSFPDFPAPSQTLFQDHIGAHQRLNMKTNSSYLLCIQSVIQCVWNAKYFEIYHHCT